MNFTNREKELLLGNAPVLSRITLYDDDGSVVQVFNEDDYIVDWEYEDYRYVPDQGFIGQFVERLLDGHFINIPDSISLEDKEIKIEIAVVDNLLQQQNYHDYGRFVITKIEKGDVSGSYKFESSDYTKKFNIPYVSNITYPCTALDLLNSVCELAGVELDADGEAVCFSVPDSGLTAGTYYFTINDDSGNTTNYEFELEDDINYHDTLTLLIDEEKLILKTIDDSYNVTREEIDYDIVASSSGTLLNSNIVSYCNFTNYDFVIENNQFEEQDTCRDVICAIAKLGYTWARIGVDNKLHLDFTKKTTVSTYNIINTDKYYEATVTGDTVTPINKVLIGMSNVDGENIYATSETYTEETESMIAIYDNPLTHSEELRRIAINGCDVLYNITYTPMSIESIGHPWLEGDDLLKLTNLEEDDLYFYPFDRKIKYNGALTTDLSAQAKNEVEQKYENKNTVLDRLHHTEIDVDKANQKIESIVQETTETNDKLVKVTQDVNGVATQIEDIEKTVDNNTKAITTIQETVEGIAVGTSITGGNNLIKNSVGYFGNDFWMVSDDTEGNIDTQNDMDVKNNSISANALLLQNTTVYQKITEIKNGSYYISFRYKRLLSTATCKLIINGEEFNLTSASWKDEGKEIAVTSNSIQITLVSNMDDSCLITDLMVSNGTAKVSWTQNANETYTDGVKIGKGITITATGSDTELSATASSIDIINTRNRESTSTFDKYGIKTNSLESKGTIRVADKLIISRVGDQMWISTL